jgi:hypothetical protein
MCLIIINTSDLSSFAHIHPFLMKKENLKLFTHFQRPANKGHVGRGQTRRRTTDIIAAFRFKVSGHALDLHAKASRGREEQGFSKVVENDSYRIDFIVPDHIAAGQNTDIIFRVEDSKGKPVLDLEPLMVLEGIASS